MVYQAVRDGFPAKAAAVVGAYTDQAAMLDAQPQMKPVVEKLWAKEIWAKALERRSALSWPDRLRVPILIQHGGVDQSVNALQAIHLAERLQQLDREYQLIVYAGDNHVLTRHREDRDAAVVRWFRDHP